MSKKLEYKIEVFGGRSLTPCPYKIMDNDNYMFNIGSFECVCQCIHYRGHFGRVKIVLCSHPEAEKEMNIHKNIISDLNTVLINIYTVRYRIKHQCAPKTRIKSLII